MPFWRRARACTSRLAISAAAAASVRYHVIVNATRELPMQLPRRGECALSALAHALMTDPDTVEEVALLVAPQAGIDVTLAIRGARKVQQDIEAAVARAQAAADA